MPPFLLFLTLLIYLISFENFIGFRFKESEKCFMLALIGYDYFVGMLGSSRHMHILMAKKEKVFVSA